MKLAVEYIGNINGKPRAVQLSFPSYKKLMLKLEHYEQMFEMKSQLTQAFEEVKKMQQGKMKKQTLSQFLGEL